MCEFPGIAGETAAHDGLVGGLRDQKGSDVVVPAGGERAGEQYDALVREAVHESGVVLHSRLLEGALAIDPARTGFTGDGEQAQGLSLSLPPERHGRVARMVQVAEA